MPALKRWLCLAALLMVASLSAAAQSNELGVLVGGYVPIGSGLDIGSGVAIEGVFSHRLAAVPLLALYGEVPVVGSFHLNGRNTFTTANFSTLFITPGLKLKLAPGMPVSPYLVAGVGYGRFHVATGTAETTDNKTVYDFGGGLDFKVFPYVSLRGEVRDFLRYARPAGTARAHRAQPGGRRRSRPTLLSRKA